jgi:DnaK suppressor protein
MPLGGRIMNEEQSMEIARARKLLRTDRVRTERLLEEMAGNRRDDRTAANQSGDMFDSAEPLTGQGTDDSVVVELQEHLAAIDRAETRLDAGRYGYSVRSGLPIPDDRLEADPAAELTVEEARQAD